MIFSQRADGTLAHRAKYYATVLIGVVVGTAITVMLGSGFDWRVLGVLFLAVVLTDLLSFLYLKSRAARKAKFE